jgi:hypothetical protein
VIDILFIAGALLIIAVISAVQLGSDSRDGFAGNPEPNGR